MYLDIKMLRTVAMKILQGVATLKTGLLKVE